MLLAVRTTLAGAACVLVTLTGCSVSFGDPSISKDNLEKGISDAVEKSAGKRPDSVTCPGKVKAKVGESISCELVLGTSEYGLTATISSYDTDTKRARYDIKLDQKPAG